MHISPYDCRVTTFHYTAEEDAKYEGYIYNALQASMECLRERMNQMIENIIKCTVREEGTTWDKSLDLIMLTYHASPQTLTRFTPYMLVTGKETNMPVDLIYGSPNSRKKIHNYDCYCSYVEHLRNSMVDA